MSLSFENIHSPNFAPGFRPTPQTINQYTRVPVSLLQAEVDGIYGTMLLADIGRIIRFYEIYEWGARFQVEGTNGDYIAANLPYMRSAILIDKQARFVFGKPAEFTLTPFDPEDDDENSKQQITILQDLVDSVLERNAFADKCLKGFKDACIGERVGVTVDFNDQGVFIKFHPSFSFVYESNEYEQLTKFIVFWTDIDSMDKAEQRVRKKKYEMVDGLCVITDETYDGTGKLIEAESAQPFTTKFTYLPCQVILNDGLTGDLDGESDIRRLADYESWYSKLANADMDAGRQGMNPVRWARDMTPESTENLPISPGAFWDLSSNKDVEDGTTGEVGILESSANYSDPLSKTIERIASVMNETVDVPNISADSMSGVITSGKTLRAIYWPLEMRSDEKMMAWLPALKFIANTIIDGVKLYPESARVYINDPVPDIKYNLLVENPYSLPEDEAEERGLDMQEVNNQMRSRKAYIMKWQNVSDKDAEKELQQIALERELLETSYSMPQGSFDLGSITGDGNAAQSIAANAAVDDQSSQQDDSGPEQQETQQTEVVEE